LAEGQGKTDGRMSLGEHLEELRHRLILALAGLGVTLVVGLMLGKSLVALVRLPYEVAMGTDAGLAVLSVTAGLMVYLKVSLIAAVVLAAPWVFYQLWMFVAAGLYPPERRYVVLAVPMSAGLFICGALFFLLVVAVPVLKFFIFFSNWMHLELVVTFANHVSMMVNMMVVFGIGFQTPLAVLLLAKMGVVTQSGLRRYRRHVIVAVLIVAMLTTPPDPFSQLSLAVPMWLLYELGVLLVRIFVVEPTGDQEDTISS